MPRPTKSYRKSSPRCRSGIGGRISISWKLFAYLTLFTFFILLVVWIMQIGLLKYFYSQSKQKEIDITDRLIADTLRDDPSDLSEIVEECATDYLICVRVFRLEGPTAHQLVSADVSGDCLIHHISDKYMTSLYNEAVVAGGVYTKRVSPQALFYTHPDAMAGWEDKGPSPGKENFRDQFWQTSLEQSVNLIHVRVLTDGVGDTYVLMLNSELEPLNATVETLKTQFWMIAFILLWGALFLAILIARNISGPIKKMNRAAKRLAKGGYDADFRVSGCREVTELSESLTHASEQLSRNDKLQKELIANISHDLRTPLTMIVGYSEVMRDIPGENTPENVQVIIDETERLSLLVNDLLDLSKLQAGSKEPELSIFDLTDLLSEVMERYEAFTKHQGYSVLWDTDGCDVSVLADRNMILQVIYNLINNAINYTGEDKQVWVRQTVKDQKVRISFTDTGSGIPQDQVELIWDRYYKLDKVHRRAAVGSGLGLSIVKEILDKHNAAYGVTSTMNVGSTFWFELPVVEQKNDAPNITTHEEGQL